MAEPAPPRDVGASLNKQELVSLLSTASQQAATLRAELLELRLAKVCAAWSNARAAMHLTWDWLASAQQKGTGP
jgi:hypothetical protein